MTGRVFEHQDPAAAVVRKRRITARNEATMRTDFEVVADALVASHRFTTDEPVGGGGTGAGPTPLTTVLAALCGCESVTFNRTAAELGLAYEGIDFVADYTIDIRGRNGDRAVRPHFQTVRMEATVTTAASADELAAVVEETEARCPVFNLLNDASVKVETVWIRRDPTA
jgi:uncharacterized OsmC-like protein